VAVVTAGTSDGPVADETAAIARAIGLRVQEIRDAGVVGDPCVAGSRAGYRLPGGGRR
jgi:NCAIR mutase (PurE)-related protein